MSVDGLVEGALMTPSSALATYTREELDTAGLVTRSISVGGDVRLKAELDFVERANKVQKREEKGRGRQRTPRCGLCRLALSPHSCTTQGPQDFQTYLYLYLASAEMKVRPPARASARQSRPALFRFRA